MSGAVIHADFSVDDGLRYIVDESSNDKQICGCSINNGEITLSQKECVFFIESAEFGLSRGDMSKFLWMAAYLIDGEQRFAPNELVSFNQ